MSNKYNNKNHYKQKIYVKKVILKVIIQLSNQNYNLIKIKKFNQNKVYINQTNI